MKLKGEIILYKYGKDFKIDVKLHDETVWLTINHMVELFEGDKSVISRHITNIYKEKELSQNSTVANFAIVQTEGNRKILKEQLSNCNFNQSKELK